MTKFCRTCVGAFSLQGVVVVVVVVVVSLFLIVFPFFFFFQILPNMK